MSLDNTDRQNCGFIQVQSGYLRAPIGLYENGPLYRECLKLLDQLLWSNILAVKRLSWVWLSILGNY